MYNKEKYKEILEYFQDDLNALDSRLKSLLFENNRNINFNTDNCAPKDIFMNNIEQFLFAKSKRLRPVVLFIIKDAVCNGIENSAGAPKQLKQTIQKITDLALALELLHSATLIHDDIIDEAHLRRGIETFNIKYNPHIATIAGDYLLSLCLKVLSGIGYCEAFSYFAQNTLNICNGEIDQFFNKNKVVTIETYLNKSKNKTSSLFLAGAKSLLYIINKEITPISDKVQGAILDFVLNFSLAFQIYDDIENFKSDFEALNTEKQSSDLKNGIYTLPFLYISQQNHLYDIINLNKDDKVYKEALEFSKNYKDKILNEAQNSINKLNDKYNTSLFIKLADVFKN